MKFAPSLHKLSNGITVLLDPMDIETVAMKILIKSGGAIEPMSEMGVSHFLEHMAFNGTQNYPTTKILRDTIHTNSGTFNAYTDFLSTAFHGRIIAEKFPVLFDILSDLVLNPLIRQEDVDKERNIIIQELKRGQDDPARQFFDIVRKNVFPDSYYGQKDLIGTIETLNTFNADILRQYKNQQYTPNKIIIAISGNFGDSDLILNEITNRFGSLKPLPYDEPEIQSLTPSILYDVKNEKKQTVLFIGSQEPYPDIRKYDYELMCLNVLIETLLNRLMEDIRHRQGLTYNFASSGYGNDYIYLQGFKTSMSPDKLPQVIKSIAHGVYDILNVNPITQAELDRYLAEVKLLRADFFESALKRRDRLVRFYADYKQLYDPNEFDELRSDLTIEDIKKHSANYFSNPISIIAQGPQCDIDMKSIWDENFN